MPGTYLLDTNAAIAHRKSDPALIKIVEDADLVFVSSITLGELYFGAYKSGRVEANLADTEQLALSGAAIACDIGTARIYGRIRNELRTKGRPIPMNDVWIAAIALQHNLTLLTRDEHFKEVDNLPLESW
jgi:tRNA(fMet)-specific endonuclease VapC